MFITFFYASFPHKCSFVLTVLKKGVGLMHEKPFQSLEGMKRASHPST